MSRPCRVVIVGRPNVGKSTLFNRLIGRRRALVHDLPGVTRDRIEEETKWWVHAKPFSVKVVDTGGLGGDKFSSEIEKQVHIALKQADVILLILDAKSGLTPQDEELFVHLKKSGAIAHTPFIGVVNKVDTEGHEKETGEFYSFGIENMVTLSAEHDRGIEELKETIARLVEFHPDEEITPSPPSPSDQPTPEDKIPHIAIVGRPNVGKSTLVNTLLGEERMITSSIAGTTIDSVDSAVSLQGKPFLLVDTAGVRRKSKTEQGVEVLSVVQTKKALERADIAVLVLDGEAGITDQDEKIGGMIEEVGCGVVLLVNKWDVHQQNKKFTHEMAAERIRRQMAFLRYAPLVFVSALKKQGLENLGDLFEEILHQRQLKIPTHEFTEWVREKSTVHNPMNARFYLCHQSGRNPPTFVCHVNDPEKIHFSLKRYLVNALRERWGYMGNPVRMNFILAKNRRSLPKKKKPSARSSSLGLKVSHSLPRK